MSVSVHVFIRLRTAQLSARSEGLEAVRVRPEAPSVRGRDIELRSDDERVVCRRVQSCTYEARRLQGATAGST